PRPNHSYHTVRFGFGVAPFEQLQTGGNTPTAQPMRGLFVVLVHQVGGDKNLDQGVLAAFAVVLVDHGRDLISLVDDQFLQLAQDANALGYRFGGPDGGSGGHFSAGGGDVGEGGGLHFAKL